MWTRLLARLFPWLRDPTPDILTAFEDQEPGRWVYALDIGRQARVGPGRLYPILMRLERRAVIESKWESIDDPVKLARRVYRLRFEGESFETLSVETPSTPSADPNRDPPNTSMLKHRNSPQTLDASKARRGHLLSSLARAMLEPSLTTTPAANGRTTVTIDVVRFGVHTMVFAVWGKLRVKNKKPHSSKPCRAECTPT